MSDQEEVRKLQYKYGYYLDKCLYKEVRRPIDDAIAIADATRLLSSTPTTPIRASSSSAAATMAKMA